MGTVAGVAPSLSTTLHAAGGKRGRSQYYELRVYTTKSDRQRAMIDRYWGEAAIPALKRLGIQPVGVFSEADKPEANKVYVLIPYDSLEAFAAVPARLAADKEYQTAGAEYLSAPKEEPAYERYESSLMVAFEGMKTLDVPVAPTNPAPRIFELRTYESRGERSLDNKVLMFNSGEIPLMREVGLGPIFFGQTILGGHQPNLIYMVSGENKEEHAKNWKAFFAAPVWKKLIGDPKYKDNVSHVDSVFLKRRVCSQI